MAAAHPTARLLLGPEGILEGYCVVDITDAHHNSPLGAPAPPDAARMREVALTDDSPVIQGFCGLAVELSVCLSFGYCELIGEEVFNAAIFIDDGGRICGKCA